MGQILIYRPARTREHLASDDCLRELRVAVQIIIDETAILAVVGVRKAGQEPIRGQSAAVALAGGAFKRLRKILYRPRSRVEREPLVARKDYKHALRKIEHFFHRKALGNLFEVVAYGSADAVDIALRVVVLLFDRLAVAGTEVRRGCV